MDHKTFFAAVRRSLFGGSLTQDVVDDLDAILAAWGTYGDGDDRKLAYVCATAFHEADRFRTMQEYATGSAYEGRRDLGNTQKGDGKRFKGRGFVQITGRRNYADWAKRTGLPLVEQPALVTQRPLAARILVQGCMLGTFTGKKLGTYITARKAHFTNARRVVNGTDKAALIAGHAQKFLAAIKEASQPAASPAAPAAKPAAPAPAVKVTQKPVATPSRPPTPPPAVARPWWLPAALWRRLQPAPAAPVEALRGDPVVFRLQRQLVEMGYGEVGEVDGAFGPKTRNALKLFRDEQARQLEIPVAPPLAAAIVAAVAAGHPRDLPPERANATAASMRQAGSTPIAAIDSFKPVAWLTGILGVGGATKDSGLLDGLRAQVDGALGAMQAVQELVLALLGLINWTVQHYYLFAIAGAIYAAWRIFRGNVDMVGLFRRNILGQASA